MTADDLATLSERAARILTGGGGVKALAKLLADALGCAVLVEDERWRHVAAASAAKGGVGTPGSFAEHFPKHAVDGRVVRATVGDASALSMAVTPGMAETAAGYVSAFFVRKPPAHAAAALRIVAGALGVDLSRRDAGGQRQRREFWERFVGGVFADVESLRGHAQDARVTLANAYVAAVFDVEGAPAENVRELVTASLAPADAICPLPAGASGVLALFPIRHLADVARARQVASNAARELVERKAARAVSAGIGDYHPDQLGVAASVDEARRALHLGRRLHGRGSITNHAELGVYALLHAGASRDDFTRFAHELIEPLAAYDRKHRTDLLATLRLYFEVGENVKEAAERLSVHRHTIFYRLNQIAQLLKVDLRAPKDQLALRAALAIRQMAAED